MKTAAELFSELNDLDEHLTVEAKTAADVGKSMLETVCAYANEPGLGGGDILLGVARVDDSLWPTYQVVGIDNPDQIQADVATQCATAFNVPIRPQVVTEKLHGKTVIVVHVHEAGCMKSLSTSRISRCPAVPSVASARPTNIAPTMISSSFIRTARARLTTSR